MFTIYDSFTGQIKRTSEVSDPAYGELALEGNFSADTHYVKKGEATPTTTKAADGKEPAKRVSKESSIQALKAAITAKGKPVDDDVLDKLTGKAAIYLTSILN